jgi:hypothetical protein
MDDRVLRIDGWMSETELDCISKLVSSVYPGGVVVEIGAWKGRSTMAIAAQSEDKVFITVDNWQGQDCYDEEAMSVVRSGKLFDIFLSNCRSMGFEPLKFSSIYECTPGKFYYITGDSREAAALFPDVSIDLWFDDGNHDHLDEDILAWKHSWKPSTILAGHDYTPVYPKVVKAVNTYIPGHRRVDALWFKVPVVRGS